MTKNTVDQRVEATVERVLPFGVFARLADGTEAYIRRRELDLDADAEPSQVVREGDSIEVVVLKLGERGKHIELSRRATLEDPWPKFARQHHAGDVVRGEVRALHPGGVFIRIQPGIDGFVPIEELAPKPMEKPEDVLWVGDEVEAVIIHIVPSKRHVRLSIKARLEQYDHALDASAQLKLSKNVSKAALSKKRETIEPQEMTETDLKNAGPVLVVEDDREVREALGAWLRQKGIEVIATDTATRALIEKLPSFRVFFVDLNLFKDDGLELIHRYRRSDCKAYICVMSSSEILAERAEDIDASRITQVFEKPLDLDEIEKFLILAARNEDLPTWRIKPYHEVALPGESAQRNLGIHPRKSLQIALSEIAELIRAQVAILFLLDPSSYLVSIVAQTGKCTLNQKAVYGLRDSPVADVIQEERPVFETHVTANANARFAKLLDLLHFESCIGVPIALQGETLHAAFFFHSDTDAFSRYRLRDAQGGVLILSALLTEKIIQERLRALNPLLISGELAAGFGHDVANKISALEMEASNLLDLNSSGEPRRARKVLELAKDLKDTVNAFRQVLETKTRVVQVDPVRALNQAVLLLHDMARKEGVQLISKVEPDLPFISGNGTLLQQIFLNIMLNAIQQMVIKANQFEWEGGRVLEITSTTKESRIQIRFRDNGPGIHKEHLRKLFTPGFSTRGGSGLGLYIAHSFVQALKGKLVLEETFVPMGTTFMVDLPHSKQDGLDD